ncbi:MAG: hypothetical protein FWD49_04010 [Firmicutes bacterium]|nr:hypothetical protein [Bacillota bacterium]
MSKKVQAEVEAVYSDIIGELKWYRPIQEVLRGIKEADPNTGITYGILCALCNSGKIRSTGSKGKIIINILDLREHFNNRDKRHDEDDETKADKPKRKKPEGSGRTKKVVEPVAVAVVESEAMTVAVQPPVAEVKVATEVIVIEKVAAVKVAKPTVFVDYEDEADSSGITTTDTVRQKVVKPEKVKPNKEATPVFNDGRADASKPFDGDNLDLSFLDKFSDVYVVTEEMEREQALAEHDVDIDSLLANDEG